MDGECGLASILGAGQREARTSGNWDKCRTLRGENSFDLISNYPVKVSSGWIHQSPVKLLYFHENLYLPWLGVPVERKVGRTLGTPEGDDGCVPHLIFSSHPLKWSIEYHFEKESFIYTMTSDVVL